MQSAFLHGDQVIVSDVFDFDKDGKKTGVVFERSQAPPTIMLFTAIDNVVELIRLLRHDNRQYDPGSRGNPR